MCGTAEGPDSFDGIPLSDLAIEEVVWTEERASHIATRTQRKGPKEIDLSAEVATEAALDPHRLVGRGSGVTSIQVVGWSETAGRVLLVWLWSEDHPPTARWYGGSAIVAGRRITRTYEEAKDDQD
ncbi:MAG: hypothetical protein ACRD0J_13675 [Acidimicrobiales bacterium]